MGDRPLSTDHGHGWLRAPAVRLGLVVHLLLAGTFAALWLALAMPRYGASFVSHGADVLVTPRGAPSLLVPAAAPVTVAGRGESLTLAAGSLVNDYAPPGGPDAVRDFYTGRDRLAAIAESGGATVSVVAGGQLQRFPLARHAATLGDLPADIWLLIAQALAIGAIGGWMWASAPGHRPARLFAASCAGVALAALSGAVFDARELTGPGMLLQVMQGLNFIGSNLCAAGLGMMFLHVPRDLADPRVSRIVLPVMLALGALEGMGVVPQAGFYAGLLVSVLVFVAIFAAQWRVSAGDPAGRAVLRWIGVATFAGTSLLSFGMAAPILLGVPSMASDGMTIFPLFAIYGGIAFGVGGVRVFALDRWSYRLALGALGLLGLLLADALLARLLRLDRPLALALALLGVGYGYFPLRAWVWQAVTGRRAVTSETLFRQAALAAFAATPQARQTGWRDLLDRMFEPLELLPCAEPVAVVHLRRQGEELLIPCTADDGALALRFARRGSRLFAAEDVATARELVALGAEAARARAEYARGVTEERQRIARDLHDDVSGLLLTGLHRTEVGLVRGDLRQALGEIRTMVASLAGRSQPLSVVLADLRFETAARLEAAGLALDWPISVEDLPDPELGYAHHKALTSALREIVTNMIRHSGGTRLTVRCSHEEAELVLDIADDGTGPTQQPRPRGATGGHGLANVEQRLTELGGQCAIIPGARGFHLTLTLPLPGAAE